MTSPAHFDTPPSITECMLGALIADRALREPFLGDLAEEFAVRRVQHGTARARRWYRGQAAWSAPYLVAACWWPAPTVRRRRLGALFVSVAGSYVTLLVLHQAAQLAAALLLPTTVGWAFVACSLAAGCGCAVLGGYLAARTLRDAPLAAALALAVTCGALGVTGMLVNGGATPAWYWGGLHLFLLPLGACVGGLVRVQEQVRHHAHPERRRRNSARFLTRSGR